MAGRRHPAAAECGGGGAKGVYREHAIVGRNPEEGKSGGDRSCGGARETEIHAGAIGGNGAGHAADCGALRSGQEDSVLRFQR